MPVAISEISIPNHMLNKSFGPPQCWCAGVKTVDEEEQADVGVGLPACMWTSPGPAHFHRCDLLLRGVFNPNDPHGTDQRRNDSLLHPVVEECLLHEKTQTRKLYLFGDSHANALLEGFGIAAAANKLAFRPLTACAHGLASYVDVVLPFLDKHLHTGDVVVIAHAAFGAVKEKHKQAVIAVHNVTSARQASMVVVGDIACDMHNNQINKGTLCMIDPDSCTVPRQSMDGPSKKKEELALFKNMNQVFGDIHVLELGDTFCTGGMCSPFIPSTNVLGIGGTCHFNAAGSYYVWPQLCNALSTLI